MFTIVKNIVSLLGFPQLLSGEFSGSGEGTLTSSANKSIKQLVFNNVWKIISHSKSLK